MRKAATLAVPPAGTDPDPKTPPMSVMIIGLRRDHSAKVVGDAEQDGLMDENHFGDRR